MKEKERESKRAKSTVKHKQMISVGRPTLLMETQITLRFFSSFFLSFFRPSSNKTKRLKGLKLYKATSNQNTFRYKNKGLVRVILLYSCFCSLLCALAFCNLHVPQAKIFFRLRNLRPKLNQSFANKQTKRQKQTKHKPK